MGLCWKWIICIIIAIPNKNKVAYAATYDHVVLVFVEHFPFNKHLPLKVKNNQDQAFNNLFYFQENHSQLSMRNRLKLYNL